MGDDDQKRTTDCVYFLASPLTCKKGNDCEYRHSEAARINPRDCWYWLSGNCLNANCSFRHPPLDGRPGAPPSTPMLTTGETLTASTTAASSASGSSSATLPAAPSTNKSIVPCYFFAQGCCAKGGKCPFLHGSHSYFRKEATTYQKPQAPEQTGNGEGNGFSYVKPQSHDSKLISQRKHPFKVAIPLQESGFIPSNVYKLTTPKGPVSAGDIADKISHIARSKLVHNTNGSSKRQGQPLDSRISQTHLGDECVQPVAPLEKGGMKGHALKFGLGRGVQRQDRQTSLIYKANTSDELLIPEMEDVMFEPDAQHCAQELHAGDLRNHLKRKKNKTTYPNHQKSFIRNEFSNDRLESSRLASKAVAVVESEDLVSRNTKRAKEDKENFSGPKTLAQIKAEKKKSETEDCFKDVDRESQGQDMIASDLEVRKKVQLASELHGKSLSESYDEGKHAKHAYEDCEYELRKAGMPVIFTPKEFDGSSGNPSVLRHSNGISSELLLLREVERSGFQTCENENAKKDNDHRVDVAISRSKEGSTDLRSEGTLRVGTLSNYTKVFQGASGTETEYISAHESMEDGRAAHAVYASEFDEDDDFVKKLGRFIS